MTGPRYSIIPHRFFDDVRPLMAHIKVMASLCRHTNKSGWCRLKQSSIADEAGCARQTANRVLADLEAWGYVEKFEKQAGRSLAYRVIMDSREDPPDDLPEEDITGVINREGVSPTDDTGGVTSDVTGVSPIGRQACHLSGDTHKNDYLTNKLTKERASAQSDFDLSLKIGGALPAITLSPTDVSWGPWIDWLHEHGQGELAVKALTVSKMVVCARWPRDGLPLPKVPRAKPDKLTDRSKAMAGEGAE